MTSTIGVQAERAGARSVSRTSARDAAAFVDGFEEARHALTGTAVLGRQPRVMAYDELGPHKYLLRIAVDGASGTRPRRRRSARRLRRQRQTHCSSRRSRSSCSRRGNISATAEALFVHPNTLRQRLRRIMELSGLDLRGTTG